MPDVMQTYALDTAIKVRSAAKFFLRKVWKYNFPSVERLIGRSVTWLVS